MSVLLSFWRCFYLCGLALLINACRAKNQQSAPTYDAPVKSIDVELEVFLDSYIKDSAAMGVPVKPAILKELHRLVWTDEVPQGASRSNIILGHCHRLNEN